MSVEEHLFTRLDAQVAAVGNRIRPNKLEQEETLPALRYARISANRADGSVMGSDSGDVEAFFQVDCYDSTYSGVRAVAESVRAALQRYSGTANGTTISQIFVEDEEDDYESSTNVHRVRFEIRIWYRE